MLGMLGIIGIKVNVKKDRIINWSENAFRTCRTEGFKPNTLPILGDAVPCHSSHSSHPCHPRLTFLAGCPPTRGSLARLGHVPATYASEFGSWLLGGFGLGDTNPAV